MTNEREANDEERVAKKGECGDGKRGEKLENWQIGKLVNWVKLVWVVRDKWRGAGEALKKREAGGLNFGKVCDTKETFQKVVRL